MRKFIVTLVILLILGAVGFGFGYVPIRLEPGDRVLMFSRTSGWDDDPLYPGVFAWRWQLLIPKNTTLYRFPSESHRVTVSSVSALPSAELYREYLEGTPLLEERIRMRIRYRISDAGIAELAPMGLDAEGIADYYADFDDRLRSVAIDATVAAVQRYIDTPGNSTLTDVVTATVTEYINNRFPEIDLEAVIPEEITVPDLLLYRLARNAYQVVQAEREATLLSVTTDATLQQAVRNGRLETLARYGEILDRHPVLLEYLEIAAAHGEDPLNLQQLEAEIP